MTICTQCKEEFEKTFGVEDLKKEIKKAGANPNNFLLKPLISTMEKQKWVYCQACWDKQINYGKKNPILTNEDFKTHIDQSKKWS